MTLDENPVPGVFDHEVFVKYDIAGCPDAPAPLTATEQGLVGLLAIGVWLPGANTRSAAR
jgi:hypothetical protein